MLRESSVTVRRPLYDMNCSARQTALVHPASDAPARHRSSVACADLGQRQACATCRASQRSPVARRRVRASAASRVGQAARAALSLRRVARLDHHPQHRLGARRANQHAPARRRARAPRRACSPASAVFDRQSLPGSTRTLINVCGNSATPRSRSANERPLRRTACSTCSALTMPSPVVWRSSASKCPEPSPPSSQPRADQLLEHVAVADLGAHERHAALAQRDLHRHVGHQRADHAIERAAPAPGGRPPARRAARRRCRAARRHRPSARGRHRRRARCRSRRGARLPRATSARGAVAPNAVVDVQAVGLAADRDDLGAELMQARRARRGTPRHAPRRPRSSAP